jgi:hypothetical protein
MSPSRVMACVALLVATAACGDDASQPVDPPDAMPPDAPGPIGPVDLDDLPAALEDAVCHFEVRCGMWPDEASCREAFDPAATDVPQLAAYVAADKLGYDAAAAGECLTAYRDAACAWVGGAIGPAAVCDQVFTGTKPADVPCFHDEECTGDSFCETQACADGCCGGVCKAKAAPVAIDGDCSAAPCVTGAYCRQDGAGTATCTAVAAAGTACTSVDGCGPDGLCHAGLCVALAADDAACDPDLGAAACAGIDRWCDPASSICARRAAVGDSCASPAQCIEGATCGGGTCVARPGLGDPCGESATGGGCLGELACLAGVCAAPSIEEVCP